MKFIRKLTRSVKDVGLGATLRKILNRLVFELKPSFQAHRIEKIRGRRFDRKYGIDTQGVIDVSEMNIPRDAASHSCYYGPTPMTLFADIVLNLSINDKEFVFLDYGSGKGRTLLLASNYRFQKIIGIELAPRINETACKNIDIYCKQVGRDSSEIVSICANATDFPLPTENLVIYFYNPFDEVIMRQVLSNIEKSFVEAPRMMYIVYVNPIHRKLVEDSGSFELLKRCQNILVEYFIFRIRPSLLE